MRFCIVGTGRCGTALLRHLLHASPEVCVYRESHWWPTLFWKFGTLPADSRTMLGIVYRTYWVSGRRVLDVTLDDIGRDRRPFRRTIRGSLSSHRRLDIAGFGALLAQAVFTGLDKPYWADKSPDYGPYMPLLQTIWPECKFIHLIRHGYPTAKSTSRHRGFQVMQQARLDTWVPLSGIRHHRDCSSAERGWRPYFSTWARRVRRIRDEATRLRRGNYLEVKYEHLLRRPEEVIERDRRLCRHRGAGGLAGRGAAGN